MTDNETRESEVVQALIQATDGKFRDWPRDKKVAIVRRAMELLDDETVWKSENKEEE